MPLHLNLHHEIQQQELARRRDPLRLSLLGALVVAIGFVGYYFVELEKSHSVNVRYENLQNQWGTMEKKYDAAKTRQTELDAQIKDSNALMTNIDSRFYWAPILGDILKSVPRNVQLVQVSGETQPGNPNNVLTVAGLASGAEPRKDAEALRIALAAKLAGNCKHVASTFKALDDSDEFVMLDGHRLATATFTIQFDLRVREPAATPTPGPARRSREAAE